MANGSLTLLDPGALASLSPDVTLAQTNFGTGSGNFNILSMFAGAGALSSLTAGYAQYQAGQQQQAAYDYNAQVVLQQMQEQEEAAVQEYSVLRGKQISGYAAAGVDVSSGSPLLILADTAMRGEEQQQEIQQAGTEQAALDIYYGKVAAYSGTVGGISTALTGLAKAGLGYVAAQKSAFTGAYSGLGV
jgi:hypothetical protein